MGVNANAAGISWERGRFDARAGPQKLLFGRMYEDAAIELTAFRPGGRIFCIASAGCTAMKLAAQNQVIAVDTNPIQLAYVERRLEGGSVVRGTAERLLIFARALAPLAGWYPSRVRAFLELRDPQDQLLYWRLHLDTLRFRVALHILFSWRILRPIYSASLLKSLPAHFGMVVRRRLERGFTRHSNRANPYARALLLGGVDDAMHFERNPSARRRIELVHADAAAYLERQPAGSFDGFALSNILDGASTAYERRLLTAVKHAAAPGAAVVSRSFGEPSVAIPTNRAAEDRTMLWGIVDVRPAATL
jgi:Protein of unknown function (DUF3419)